MTDSPLRRLLPLALILLAALMPQRLAAEPADIAAAVRGVVRVVLISDDADGVALVGHGSGFAVAPNLIVTNAHVVAPLAQDSALRAGVVPSQGKTGYFVKVVAYSPQNDLALLRLAEPGALVPATLFTGAVSDGQEVWAVGYPGNVDRAQGLSAADLMSPIEPVKTHGSVSAGRSNRSFDTLLHTAPIGAGNSGGPLLDGCGRVIGANSFGTQDASGADSAFYFAVSMREISRFLIAQGIKPATTGEPCRSLADFQKAEQDRLASEQAASQQAARAAEETRKAALEKAARQAELDVISERDNRMALAGLALLMAIGAAAASFALRQSGKLQHAKGALIAAAMLLIGAPIAWLSRPSLDEIDTRAEEASASASPAAASASASASAAPLAGQLVCVIDPSRSRITVSQTTDVPLGWSADGCVNGKSQYGLGPDGWSRILAPKSEDTVTIASFDPAARSYRTDRYLLDAATMGKVRAARDGYTPAACGIGEAAARKLGEDQQAVKALLPEVPNERLVYRCSPAP